MILDNFFKNLIFEPVSVLGLLVFYILLVNLPICLGAVFKKKSSFTVRKISFGEGVERTFALYSPNVDSIKVIRAGKVRRAKLYYLRDRKGKSARIAEKIKKKIGVDVSVKPEEQKVKPIEPTTQETKVEEIKKEAPKVEAKAEKPTSEKK